MTSTRSRDESDVELPLLRSGHGIDGDEASNLHLLGASREESVQVSGRSGLAAGIANMSNSIIGAGIIGMSKNCHGWCIVLDYAEWVKWLLQSPGLPLAIAEAGFFTGIFLLVVLCGVTDW